MNWFDRLLWKFGLFLDWGFRGLEFAKMLETTKPYCDWINRSTGEKK